LRSFFVQIDRLKMIIENCYKIRSEVRHSREGGNPLFLSLSLKTYDFP